MPTRRQLYLDERHIEWMSERTLQYVLSDLRPLYAVGCSTRKSGPSDTSVTVPSSIPEKLQLERPHLLGATSTSGPKQFQSKVETSRGGACLLQFYRSPLTFAHQTRMRSDGGSRWRSRTPWY